MLIFSVIFYFICTLTIGYWASKRVHTSGDFINAGRNLHPAMNTAALFALWFGSETIFGASAEFAEFGISGIIEDPLGGVLCLLLVGFIFSKRLYKLNIYTIGDLFRKNYGPRVEMVSSILMIISFIGYAAAQIVALGLISQTLLGISLPLSMLLSLSIVVIYTYTGGMWAVSLTDFIQSILIVFGLIAISWFVTDKLGGVDVVLSGLTQQQKKILPENTSIGWLNWISAWLVLGFGSIASQDIFQRINSARNETAAYSSTIYAAIIYLIISMLPLYLITAIKKIDPLLLQGDLQLALPKMVLNDMPVWIQVVFFGSLMSAIMSTCSGALLAPASLLSENIIKPYLSEEIEDSRFLWFTRISVIVIGSSAFIIALSSQNIFALVGEASIIGLVSIFVPFVATLIFGHSNSFAAIFSMLSGSVIYAIFRIFPLTEINPLLPGFLGSIAGLGLGQFFGKYLPDSLILK